MAREPLPSTGWAHRLSSYPLCPKAPMLVFPGILCAHILYSLQHPGPMLRWHSQSSCLPRTRVMATPSGDFTLGHSCSGKSQTLKGLWGQCQTQCQLTVCWRPSWENNLTRQPCLVLFTTQMLPSSQPPPHETTSAGTTGPHTTKNGLCCLVAQGADSEVSWGRVSTPHCLLVPTWRWASHSASLLSLLTCERKTAGLTSCAC